MGNNTEVVFDNIEQRILKEIEDAHYAIFVSVAWFTNKKLFQALLEKAKSNCYVSIIIQLDDINSQCGIDYSQIQVGRSECFMISKDAELLHDKFCVIDFRKVITGSYNWTYKAAHNSENILILNDPSVATQYITRFEQQKSKYAESSVGQGMKHVALSNSIVENKKAPEAKVEVPTTKKCSHCQKDIGVSDIFCFYCGEQQEKSCIARIRVCHKCKHVQKEPLLDASKTHYCTYCGEKLSGRNVVTSETDMVKSDKLCPICKNNMSHGSYCSFCGLRDEVSADVGLRFRDEIFHPLDARREYSQFTDYQLCPKCRMPNYFGVHYCRNCGEDITFHSKDIKAYGWIDLGLSVLWSTETMEGYYPWMDSKNKLCSSSDYLEDFINDGKDVASVIRGSKWRIPTKEEFEELIHMCDWEKIVIPNSNKNALKVIGPNGNYIVLPTTGFAGCHRRFRAFNNEALWDTCKFWTSSCGGNKNSAFAFTYIGYHASDFFPIFTSKKDRERSNELWLKTPINKEQMKYCSINETLSFFGYAIRPVVDKKWQGYI